MRATQQAFRERLFAALTVPALTYRLKGVTLTLAAGQVVPRPIWLITPTGVPNIIPPLVSFQVESRGGVGRVLNERLLGVKIWTVSTDGPDECLELYEAVRSRLHMADQDSVPFGPADLSAGATTTTYPIAVRQMYETRCSDVGYDVSTKHFYLVAEYHAAAN